MSTFDDRLANALVRDWSEWDDERAKEGLHIRPDDKKGDPTGHAVSKNVNVVSGFKSSDEAQQYTKVMRQKGFAALHVKSAKSYAGQGHSVIIWHSGSKIDDVRK